MFGERETNFMLEMSNLFQSSPSSFWTLSFTDICCVRTHKKSHSRYVTNSADIVRFKGGGCRLLFTQDSFLEHFCIRFLSFSLRGVVLVALHHFEA